MRTQRQKNNSFLHLSLLRYYHHHGPHHDYHHHRRQTVVTVVSVTAVILTVLALLIQQWEGTWSQRPVGHVGYRCHNAMIP